MTKKNILAYKLLSLNISDFNLFLYENCNPPEKKSPPLSQQSPLKVEVLSSPPPQIFENLVAHYRFGPEVYKRLHFSKTTNQ